MTELLGGDTLAGALGRFHLVPPAFAEYEVGLEAAARVVAVDPDRLVALAGNGLPHAVDAGRGPLFDYNDVLNLATFGNHTGQSIPELAVRFLLRFATDSPATWYQPKQWLVRVRAMQAPVDGHASQQVMIRLPDFAAPGVAALTPSELGGEQTIEMAEYQVAVRLTGAAGSVRSPQARSMYQGVLDELTSGAVIYQAVAESLRMEHNRAWHLGMADCVVVGRLLADRLRRAGLVARARRGYLLGLVGSDHAWCELYEDDRWKPLDAVFAFLTSSGAEARRLEPVPEFTAACLGGRFNRLLPCVSDEAVTLVHIDGKPAPPWALAGVSARPWES